MRGKLTEAGDERKRTRKFFAVGRRQIERECSEPIRKAQENVRTLSDIATANVGSVIVVELRPSSRFSPAHPYPSLLRVPGILYALRVLETTFA